MTYSQRSNMFFSIKTRLPELFLILLLSLSLTSQANAQTTTAEVGIFETQQVAPDETLQVPVSVRNVTDLYGLDVIIEFDPAIIQVEDSDPSRTGVQVSLGTFLEPGLLLFNTVDNEQGTIHFAMSQVNPSEAKSGQGVLLVITFSGVTAGESPLEVTELMLGTREGVEINSQGVNSSITVSAGVPAQAVTYPVADVGSMIVVNTLAPTPLPSTTNTPLPITTPTPSITEAALTPTRLVSAEPAIQEAAPGDNQNPAKMTPEQSNQAVYFLVQNWWILVILLVAVIAAGLYYYKIKQPAEAKEEKT